MIRGPLFCLFHPRQAWHLIDALIESCASCDLDIELLTAELHEHRAVTAGHRRYHDAIREGADENDAEEQARLTFKHTLWLEREASGPLPGSVFRPE
jgi:hypothetical protein